jgi:phosphatidylinositol alpha-1,6-mannosyltransferase
MVAAGEDPRQADFDRGHDLRVVRIPLSMRAWGLLSGAGLRGYWKAVRRLRTVIRKERVEKVHCGRCLPEGVMAVALKWCYGIPYSCYVHGEDVTTASTSRELRWLTNRVLRGADFVIPNSRNTEHILKKEWHLPDERIRLMHPGVDTNRFVPAARNLDVRTRLGWCDRPIVLTVGRLQKRKGQDQMISALSSIRRSIPDILYAVVGDGEERGPLEELVARQGLDQHVQFLGELDDERLLRCYQQCDLFVLPNRQVGRDIEGFGMVLLEAQACGKAVVAGASGGTAETMRIPETGRVVCCDGPHDLGALVIELLDDRDLLARMGVAARHWVVERFDWAALTRQAGQLFRVEPKAVPSFSARAG